MTSPEGVFIARLDVPTKLVLQRRRPEHEVQDCFPSHCVCCSAGLPCVNPLGTNAGHEFDGGRKRPRLLEQKVARPFCCMATETGRHPSFKLKPVFNRGDLNGDRRSEARRPVLQIPAWSCAYLDNGRLFCILLLLRRCVSEVENKRCCPDALYRTHREIPM